MKKKLPFRLVGGMDRIRGCPSVLLDPSADVTDKKEALVYMFEFVQQGNKLGFDLTHQEGLLGHMMTIINQQDQDPRMRIYACRVLSAILAERSTKGSINRWLTKQPVQESRPHVLPAEQSPRQEISVEIHESSKKSIKKASPKTSPKNTRKATPRNSNILPTQKVIKNLDSSEALLGYIVPMMWYPKAPYWLKCPASRKIDLPPLESDLKIKSKIQGRKSDLDVALQQEHHLWNGIDKYIKSNRVKLPTGFLLEQGLEVAYTRELAKRVLNRLFTYAGREPLRGPFRKWHEMMLAERFTEFVKYAGMDKLQTFILHMLSRRKTLAWNTWQEYIETHRYNELVRAAIVFQRVHRGNAGRRFYLDRLQKWKAAIKIQTPFRVVGPYCLFRSKKRGAIFIQKMWRMWTVQSMLRTWHNCAVKFQKYVRMFPCRRYFLKVQSSVIVLQTTLRGFACRISIKEKMVQYMKLFENDFVAALTVQTCWHRYKAASFVRGIHSYNTSLDNAALMLQTRWYVYKEQFPAYIMMRCYYIQDEVDKIEKRRKEREARQTKLVKVQCLLRQRYAIRLVQRMKLEFKSSKRCQALCRSFVSRQKVKRFRSVVVGICRIQVCIRKYLSIEKSAATKIQKLASRQPQRTHIEISSFSIIQIQTFFRRMQAVIEVTRRRSAFVLQRSVRCYLARKIRQSYLKTVRDRVINKYVCNMVFSTLGYISYNVFQRQLTSAIIIQAWYKRNKQRIHVAAMKQYFKLRTKNATRIQKIYKGVSCRKALAKQKVIRNKNLSNRYRSIVDPIEIVESAKMHCTAFYDPIDPLVGMHPSIWLQRLGLSRHWEAFSKVYHVKDLSKLLTLPKSTVAKVLDGQDLLDFMNMKGISKIKCESRHNSIFDLFQPIRDYETVRAIYLKHYGPNTGVKESNFIHRVPLNRISTLQLEKHCIEFENRPKEAKEYLDEKLLCRIDEESVVAWERRRYKQAFGIYQMAVEQILRSTIPDDLQRMLGNALYRAGRPAIKDSSKACCELFSALTLVHKLAVAVKKIQVVVRGKLSRVFVRAALAKKRYREDLLEGGILKRNWILEKEKEAKEWQEYTRACKQHEIEQYLQTILPFGVSQLWDDQYQAYYYQSFNEEFSWEMPTYSIHHYDHASRIQNTYRCFKSRHIRKLLAHLKQRDVIRKTQQIAWEGLESERENLVTFKISVHQVDSDNPQLGLPVSWRRKWDPHGMNGWEANKEAAKLKIIRIEQNLINVEESLARVNIFLQSTNTSPTINIASDVEQVDDKSEMEWEDIRSALVQQEYFEKSNLMYLFVYQEKFAQSGTQNSYDSKIQRRKELKSILKISSVTRGFMVRRKLQIAKWQINKSRYLAQIVTLKADIASRQTDYDRLFVAVKLSSVYTHVPLPIGWTRKQDGYGRVFYTDGVDAIWDRPAYKWEHEFGARTIQRIYRGYRGRCDFINTLQQQNIPETARNAITNAAKIAWYGFHDEGITVQMWFARRGLYHVLKETLEAKANLSKTLTSNFRKLFESTVVASKESLEKIGITDPLLIDQVLAYTEADDVCIIRTSDQAKQLFADQYPNQGARAIKFSQQPRLLSSTPITILQLKKHIARYQGKPSLAMVQLPPEVLNLPTTSTPEEELQAAYVLLGAIKRIMILLRNMTLYSLHNVLKTQCENAMGRLITKNQDPALPGPWLCNREYPMEASAAFSLRCTLDLILSWWTTASKIQTTYRNFINLKRWREITARYRKGVTMIQCTWRSYAARRSVEYRHYQFVSSWEELYDEENDCKYYFDNRTQTSQWFPPNEIFKPYKWWPPHPDDIPVPHQMCFECRQEEALRVCHECINKNGIEKQFCFDCFAKVHDSGKHMARHKFSAVEQSASDSLQCAQCSGDASRHCGDCIDFFCLACYRKLHSKGSRLAHSWVAFQPTAVSCIECRDHIATVFCEDCKDPFCKSCAASLHSNRRRNHKITSLPDPIIKSGTGK